MMKEPAIYTGRFAPSPTGPLHFGSLLAAVTSYARALVNGGRWLVRIEDIDPPREQAGSDKLILNALSAFGFEWDGPVVYQSASVSRHLACLEQLRNKGLVYPCSCSRRDLAEVPRGPLGSIYPGTCRNGCKSDDVAIRIRTNNDPLEFADRLQGRQCQRLQAESGDFIVRRRDGMIAYHLAVVVDDFDQGVTEVVRGIDLLDSTPRQIHLQLALGFSTPDYMHIPVAVNRQGQKLGKLTGATAISMDNPGPLLCTALDALGQRPPADLAGGSTVDIWRWVSTNWQTTPMNLMKVLPAAQFGYG